MVISLMIIWDYNTYMGYVDLGERVINSYLIHQTWKWTDFLSCGNWLKRQGSTSPLLAPVQALYFTETSYVAWSKLQQSSAISFLHTVLLSLLCTKNKNESSSQSATTVMWDCVLVSVFNTIIKNWNCEYQWVMAGPQNQRYLNKQVCNKKGLLCYGSYSMIQSKHTQTSICNVRPFTHTFYRPAYEHIGG
jgi:Na+-transporting NADH:ubiquinone oxidoreductase subunit NqrB